MRGTNKGREGKVTSVYRLKYALHINGGAYTFINPRPRCILTTMQLSVRRATASLSRSPSPPQRSLSASSSSTRYARCQRNTSLEADVGQDRETILERISQGRDAQKKKSEA